MSQNSNQNVSWQQLSSVLTTSELGATPSECHGIICGLICGGINVEDNSWSGAFNDLMNDGLALPPELKKLLKELFDDAVNQFIGGDYQLKLLLNDDNQSLSAVAQSLTQWSESFMAGFAIGNESKKKLSKDVTEALGDLGQISQLDTDVEDDEESQRAFEEIAEYVRVSAMLCFSELGQKPAPADDKKNLH
ncbi:MAG: UPF0149 family protein [Psychrobium sp.]